MSETLDAVTVTVNASVIVLYVVGGVLP
jgi:hypothetical protein